MFTAEGLGSAIAGRIVSVASLVAALVLASTGADAGPHLGREPIAAWDLSIGPDGAGLPPGRGTAGEGKPLYLAKCAQCHGPAGEGGAAEPLVGGIGTLDSATPLKTVGSYWPYATTLFDYVRRTMPYDRPMSLSSDEFYALCAYVLFLNGIISGDAELTAETLPRVEMPNRRGFTNRLSTSGALEGYAPSKRNQEMSR